MSFKYALDDAEWYRAIAESLRDGVVAVDMRGSFCLWNSAASNILGKGPESIPPPEWAAHYGFYRSDGKTPYRPTSLPLIRALRGEIVVQERLWVRHNARPSGVLVEGTATPVFSASGDREGAVVLFREVTPASGVPAEASVPDRSDAGDVEEIRRQFLRALSHAFRTPLTSIVGYADLLHDLGPDELPPEARELVEPIRAGGVKLDAILNDLIDLHQLTSGEGELHLQETAIRRLVMRVAARVDIGRRSLDIDVADVSVMVDTEQIERMLHQLIDNAVRHTPPRTRITIQVRRVRNGVILVVQDNGPGLAGDLKSLVFDAFRRGDPEEGNPGIGLGLTLVRHYAELHGGEVWVEDVRGGTGVRVVVRLPQG